ncbi:uncharacterized protein TNCV_646251 [Trichonephila clavipes]|nr:uncharacterized protein TNCV_646251 [Trichonephila clavipes]
MKNRLRTPSTDLSSRRPPHQASGSSRTIQRRRAGRHLGSRRPLRVLPLTPTHQCLLIFLHDNARSHTARVSQDCFRNVTTFLWHARSPDLSPIKHIYLEYFGTMSWASHELERTRGKVTANMNRNVSRHHTELLFLNARSYHIVLEEPSSNCDQLNLKRGRKRGSGSLKRRRKRGSGSLKRRRKRGSGSLKRRRKRGSGSLKRRRKRGSGSLKSSISE